MTDRLEEEQKEFERLLNEFLDAGLPYDTARTRAMTAVWYPKVKR